MISRLWKSEWFKYLCIFSATLAVIVVSALLSPPKQNEAKVVYTEEEQTEPDIPAAEFNRDSEEKSDIVYPQTLRSIAAKWVDDEVVFMSGEETAEFEKKMYDCETKDEYRKLMESIVYYNKYIDISRFLWYEN